MIGSYAYALLLCGWAAFHHPPSTASGAVISLFGWPLVLALAGITISYAGIGLVGLPTWLALRRVRAEGLLTYALAGLIGGSLVPLLLPDWSVVTQGPLFHSQIAGMLVMASFWLIAKGKTE
jgi:hypothetical protein